MIRVYIVDDHAVVIEGICSLLQNEEGIEVVGHATNAAHCLEYFASQKADIILMDIGLPDMIGTDLCTQLRTNCPGLVVLALSNFNQGTYVRKMMEGGAKAFGDSAAIGVLEEGEDHGLKDYQDDLPKLDGAARTLVNGTLLPSQHHTHRVMSDLKQMM